MVAKETDNEINSFIKTLWIPSINNIAVHVNWIPIINNALIKIRFIVVAYILAQSGMVSVFFRERVMQKAMIEQIWSQLISIDIFIIRIIHRTL